jgi:hypothetical protein
VAFLAVAYPLNRRDLAPIVRRLARRGTGANGK